MREIDSFIKKLSEWTKTQDGVLAIGYMGSWARNQAKPTSDFDLMIITDDTDKYLRNSDWINYFGEIKSIKREDWGLVQTWRVFFTNEAEVEFNITTKEWTNIPVDSGTARVVGDGMKIVFDPHSLLANLETAVKNKQS